jgi:hypothetical protein
MVAGCPRTVSDSPEENIELGEKMIQWVTENNPIHLSQWYSLEMFFTYNEWKTLIKRKEFIPYYEKALYLVGLKYLDKTSNIREGISQRWQRVYFKDLKEEEDETAKMNSDLRKEEKSEENKNELTFKLQYDRDGSIQLLPTKISDPDSTGSE